MRPCSSVTPVLLVLLALCAGAQDSSTARTTTSGGVDVPLSLWTGPGWGNGLRLGITKGAAFGDYDGDGWIDVYIGSNAKLFHNENGVTWTLADDLDSVLPQAGRRYGGHFADYDGDGLLDIATSPRVSGGDSSVHLLHNLGGGPFFEDVAVDPELFVSDRNTGVNGETICWGDVDDDGDTDLFVSAYQPPDSGHLFFQNMGPTGPGGAYRMVDTTIAAGLLNGTNTSRPEGAQLVDVDRDGDLDIFANATIYQNRTVGEPLFVPLVRQLTGIGFANALDEGAVLFDYDMDGDQDLLVLYVTFGNRLWESRGDGTFVENPTRIELRQLGSNLGMSAEDWDNDGDLDLTTTDVFRRNMLMETGEPRLEIATHDIPDEDLLFATPAWGDWDRDGDLDVLIANFDNMGRLYENTTYDAATPEIAKNTVRIRVATDAPGIPRGLETEYGATVEIRVHGDESGLVRRRFVASSHGYLNQNEYALQFALPPGPDPAAPAKGVRFDVSVDFPSLPRNGILRVDPLVNQALAGIELAALSDREIIVFRSGAVRIDGVLHRPRTTQFSRRLRTTTGGLILPDLGAPLPDPLPAPADAWWVGLEVDTAGAKGPARVVELLLDGVLDEPDACGGFNVAAWDVTGPGRQKRVYQGAFATRERNRRSFLPLQVELRPNRLYRFVARVTELRGTPIAGPVLGDPLSVNGGLSFQDLEACDAGEVASAVLDPSQVPMALRFRGPKEVPAGNGPSGRR